ncbi:MULTISPECIES: hypothetical protein [unclassified Streptomyces]|uniref:hypothetical protein n=1 Tax=unclassified Streptomyces TaxID=2593676 RepID=UPI0038189E2E
MTEAGKGQETPAKETGRRVSLKALVGVAVFSYLVSRTLMGGAWYLPVLFLAVVAVVFVVRNVRQAPMAGMAEVRREAVQLLPLTRRLERAQTLGEAGDLAAAVELIDSVAADSATARLPLLAANVAMMRSDIAAAQGDLPTAEREALIAVHHQEQGENRSTRSEALEKLGKIQLVLGRNQEAYDTITRAVEVGADTCTGSAGCVRSSTSPTSPSTPTTSAGRQNTPRLHGSSPPNGAAGRNTPSPATYSPCWRSRRTASTMPPGGPPRPHGALRVDRSGSGPP